MFLPTSVNVTPPSRLTCTFPSSVPAHTTPRDTGDSDTAMIVPYDVTPSFFDSIVRSPAMPINGRVFRSICLVRSSLAIHVSPRFEDRNKRLPPSQMLFGSCGESMNGVFQLKRY